MDIGALCGHSILNVLFYNWIDKRAVAQFDSALCNHLSRGCLLQILSMKLPHGYHRDTYRRNFASLVLQYKYEICQLRDPLGKCARSQMRWHALRGVDICSLSVLDTELSGMFVNIVNL